MDDPKTNSINRRDLLKALGAAGGALAAAAFLPGKWAKPVVEAGVMPAHAQSSALSIFSLGIQSLQPNQSPGGGGYDWEAQFGYNDPLGDVDMSTKLFALAQPCAQAIHTGQSLSTVGASFIPGSDAFNGGILFLFNGVCVNSTNPELWVTLEADGRTSNTISALYPFTCASPEC